MNQKRFFYILFLAYSFTTLPSLTANSSARLLVTAANVASSLMKKDEIPDLDSVENDNATAPILAPNSARSVRVTGRIQSTFADSSHRNDDIAYECLLCKITFFSLYEVESHFKDKHSEKKIFECKYCKKELAGVQNLESHIASFHDQNNEFPCLVLNCPLFFKNERARTNHICKEHPKEAKRIFRTCQICNKEFNLRHHLISHNASFHNQKEGSPCEFPNCPFYFTSERSRAKHISEKHTEEARTKHIGKAHPEEVKKIFRTCQVCNKEFDYRRHLISHIASFHDQNNEFPCLVPNCPFRLTCERARTNHICKNHPEEAKKILNTCQICNKEFDRRHHLISHIDSFHRQENEFPCLVPNCPFRLTSERSRAKHISEKHTEEARTKYIGKAHPEETKKILSAFKICDDEKKVCDKSLKNTNSLKEHQRSHKAERPFKCDICHKKFRKKGCLKKHRKKHVKELLINKKHQENIDLVDVPKNEPTDKENVKDHVNQNIGVLSASWQIKTSDEISPIFPFSTSSAAPNGSFRHFGTPNNLVRSHGEEASANNNFSNRWDTYSGISENMLDNHFQNVSNGTFNVNASNPIYSSVHHQPSPSVQTNTPYFDSPAQDLPSNASIFIAHNTYPHSMDLYNAYNHPPTSSTDHSEQYSSLASPSYTLNCLENDDDLDNFFSMSYDFNTENVSNSPNNLLDSDKNNGYRENNFDINYPATQANTNLQHSTRHTYQENNQNNSSNRSYSSNIQQPNNPTYGASDTYVSSDQNSLYTTSHLPFETPLALVNNNIYPQNLMSNNPHQPYVQPSHTNSSACTHTNTAAGSGDNAFSVAPSNNQTNSVQASKKEASVHFEIPTGLSPLLGTLPAVSPSYTGMNFTAFDNLKESEINTGAEITIMHPKDLEDTRYVASFNIFNHHSHCRFEETNSLFLPSFSVEPTPFFQQSFFGVGNTNHNQLSTSDKDKLPAHADGTKISPTDFRSTE